MLISMGQIVVATGDAKGLEIVGVIQKRSDANALVKQGVLPREVLASAVAAGAMTVAAEESEDDLFEKLADEEDVAGGGSKVERSKAESLRSVAALAGRLGSKSAPVSKTIVESAADASVYDAAEYDAFSSPKRVKRKVAPAPASIPMRSAAEPETVTFWDNAPEKEEKPFVAQPLARAPVSWEDEIDIDAI